MIVYACMPIDFWSGWQRPEAVFRLDTTVGIDCFHHRAEDWALLWEQARRLARRVDGKGISAQAPTSPSYRRPRTTASRPPP
jgi:hypothetical protein